MKKVLLALTVLFTLSTLAYSAVTIEEIRSREKMREEGYSDAVIKIVQKEAGEYNPKPTNKLQRFGFKIWKYIDPAAPEPRDAESHSIKEYPHYSDL